MNNYSSMKLTALALAIGSVLLGGFACANEATDPTNKTELVLENMTPEQVKKVTDARTALAAKGYDENQQAAIDLAIEAVNSQTPIDKESISNLKIKSVQWPDSSLGCPSPGQQYLQVLVPGYLVNFNANGTDYSVSTGNGSAVVCDQLENFMTDRRARSQAIMKTQRAARSDLAEKLMVELEQVKVTKMKLETFPDTRLGCEENEPPEMVIPVDGLIINLSCGDHQYEYRAALGETQYISCKQLESCHETE